MGDGTDGRDDRILAMIGAAVLAGAYSTLALELPEAERGLLKLARKWSARAGTLATEICEAARFEAGAAARSR